jgi:hypothetical protein
VIGQLGDRRRGGADRKRPLHPPGSFVPPKPIRQLRDLTRLRKTLMADRARHRNRIAKDLEDAQVKLSSVASDLFGASGRAILDALVAGTRSPGALADLAHPLPRAERGALIEALTGQFEDHHAFLIRVLLEDHDRPDRPAHGPHRDSDRRRRPHTTAGRRPPGTIAPAGPAR